MFFLIFLYIILDRAGLTDNQTVDTLIEINAKYFSSNGAWSILQLVVMILLMLFMLLVSLLLLLL